MDKFHSKAMFAPAIDGHVCTDKLRTEWTNLLLRWSWQLEGTFTFEFGETDDEKCLKLVKPLQNMLAMALFGKRYQRNGHPGVRMFAVVEPHKSGWLHVHAAFGGLESNQTQYASRFIRENWNYGIIQVGEIRDQYRYFYYITKFVPITGHWYMSRHTEMMSKKS